MLNRNDAVANIAVRNLAAARKFYAGTLGLEEVDAEANELIVFRSGNTSLFVYRSDHAGTNRATAVTWMVGDEIENDVRALKAKGVAFERCDVAGLRREGDLHVGGGMMIAWFKDPDGNILSLVGG